MGAELSSHQCACVTGNDDGRSDEIKVAEKPNRGQDMVSSIVVVERMERMAQGGDSAASTIDGFSSKCSDVSSISKGRRISLLKTPGLAAMVAPSKIDKTKLAIFKESIHAAGVDTIKWGYGGTKSVEHLYWETYEQRGCAIISMPGPQSLPGTMKRVTRLVKINLIAEIFGIDHTLLSRMQFMHDGQTVERRQVPLQKLRWPKQGSEDIQEWKEDFYAEDCSYTESWKEAVSGTLEQRLGLSQAWQLQHLVEDDTQRRFFTEDDVQSDGYPGLNTLYCIHECTFRVRDPLNPGVSNLGLPVGREFATAEGDFNFNGQQDDSGLSIGTQLNIWCWSRQVVKVQPKTNGAVVAAKSTIKADPKNEEAERAKHRMPTPLTSLKVVAQMERNHAAKSYKPPVAALWATLSGMKTDWARARKIAQKIQDPNYSVDLFSDDLQCFPELSLYLLENRKLERQESNVGESPSNSSSGRTMGDEYQRTLGAFFAIYWLVRMDFDGKDGFCNGVDAENSFIPIVVSDPKDTPVSAPEKRMAFKSAAKWAFFQRLLVNAGVLEKKSTSFPFRGSKLQVNEKRLVSLLALTAVHDIMKMNFLLPEVQPEHAPYHGYAAGDTIGDHDHALSYIMEHYPNALPSFCDLDENDRRSVMFTQCNLSFNHGWFVQGEAPPGAIFTKFRETLIRDHKSQIGQRDVALYFVHWITDLAGAEPTPLAGCEKFVTKFPMPVLNSFLRSFEFVERITDKTETEVIEDYLQMRWTEHSPSLGPVPMGDHAIAKMRLACMAQMNAGRVIKEFDDLIDEDRETLSIEMARTGCVGQHYSPIFIPRDAYQTLEGPAFLIYYGPAFLQSLGTDSAVRRLSILAEIYRRARELWPPQVSKIAQNVTIRIDMIKSLSIQQIQEAHAQGDVWMMVKHNENEAFLERSSNKKVNRLIAGGQQLQIVDLSCLRAYRHLP